MARGKQHSSTHTKLKSLALLQDLDHGSRRVSHVSRPHIECALAPKLEFAVYLSTAFARKDIVLHGALQVVIHGCWLVLRCLLRPDKGREVLLTRIRSSSSGSMGERVVNQ